MTFLEFFIVTFWQLFVRIFVMIFVRFFVRIFFLLNRAPRSLQWAYAGCRFYVKPQEVDSAMFIHVNDNQLHLWEHIPWAGSVQNQPTWVDHHKIRNPNQRTVQIIKILVKYNAWELGHLGLEFQLPVALNKDGILATLTVHTFEPFGPWIRPTSAKFDHYGFVMAFATRNIGNLVKVYSWLLDPAT